MLSIPLLTLNSYDRYFIKLSLKHSNTNDDEMDLITDIDLGCSIRKFGRFPCIRLRGKVFFLMSAHVFSSYRFRTGTNVVFHRSGHLAQKNE